MEYNNTKITYYETNTNMDNIRENARFIVNQHYSEVNPSGIIPIIGWAIVETELWSLGTVMQKIIDRFTPNIIYIRIYENNIWTDWYRL